MENSPDRSAYVIFCDDIRDEIGGKYSYIGVYRGIMLIHAPLPVALPKLGLAVTIFQRTGKVSSRVLVHVFAPEQPDNPALETLLDAPPPEFLELNLPKKYVAATANILIAPFPILAEGALTVKAIFDDGEPVLIGSLQISRAPKAE